MAGDETKGATFVLGTRWGYLSIQAGVAELSSAVCIDFFH